MKLTNSEIDILKNLVQHRLQEQGSQTEHSDRHLTTEILEKIQKKLDTMYFQ